MDKKRIITICSSFIIIIILLIFTFNKINMVKIYNIIDKKTLYRTTQIISSNNSMIDAKFMLEDMNKSKYKKYYKNINLESANYYTFLDENNNILFRYIDTNYNKIVGFEINGQVYYYIKKGVLN